MEAIEDQAFWNVSAQMEGSNGGDDVTMTGALGEGQRTLLWIWFSETDDENSPDMHECEQIITSS